MARAKYMVDLAEEERVRCCGPYSGAARLPFAW